MAFPKLSLALLELREMTVAAFSLTKLSADTSEGPSADALLLESGDYLLLESGDNLILE